MLLVIKVTAEEQVENEEQNESLEGLLKTEPKRSFSDLLRWCIVPSVC